MVVGMALEQRIYRDVLRLVGGMAQGDMDGAVMLDVAEAAGKQGIRRMETALALDGLIESGDIESVSRGRVRITKGKAQGNRGRSSTMTIELALDGLDKDWYMMVTGLTKEGRVSDVDVVREVLLLLYVRKQQKDILLRNDRMVLDLVTKMARTRGKATLIRLPEEAEKKGLDRNAAAESVVRLEKSGRISNQRPGVLVVAGKRQQKHGMKNVKGG